MGSLRFVWLATRYTSFSRRLSGWFAARLWFTPWRFPRSEKSRAREAAWLDGSEHFYLDAGDHQLAATAMGCGPVVLLVHGWGERSASVGALLRPVADSGFRAVAIDLPGHGATSRGQTNALTAASAIEAAATKLRARYVIAHSIGAVGTMLALRDGLALKGVVLIAPTVRLEHAVDKFVELFSLPTRSADGLRDVLERRFGPTVWSDLAVDKLAPNFPMPALIVHDVDDPQVPISDAEALEAAWPVATLVKTEGLGHMKPLADPSVIERVTSFLTWISHDRALVSTLAR